MTNINLQNIGAIAFVLFAAISLFVGSSWKTSRIALWINGLPEESD